MYDKNDENNSRKPSYNISNSHLTVYVILLRLSFVSIRIETHVLFAGFTILFTLFLFQIFLFTLLCWNKTPVVLLSHLQSFNNLRGKDGVGKLGYYSFFSNFSLAYWRGDGNLVTSNESLYLLNNVESA